MKYLFLALFLQVLCFAEERVELIANYEVNYEGLSAMVEKIVVPNAPDCQKRIFWNLTKKNLLLKEKKEEILFMWEPPTVLPKMYKKKHHRRFARIYTWDDDLVDDKKYFKLYYPDCRPMIEKIPPFEEKKFCTMVVGKHKSNHPKELYSEREQIIQFFEKKPKGEFQYFGRGWDDTYSSYRGEVENKIEAIKDFRFSICYENCKEVKGYITEKIFDCFAAGNVPVYLGASNIGDYIPEDCFIDRRKFASNEELYQFLKGMKKESYESYIENIRAFLKSESAQFFTQSQFQKIFREATNTLFLL